MSRSQAVSIYLIAIFSLILFLVFASAIPANNEQRDGDQLHIPNARADPNRRSNAYVTWNDVRRIEDYDNFWLHKSCYSVAGSPDWFLIKEDRDKVEETLKYGVDYIKKAVAFVRNLKGLWPSLDPNECSSSDDLQGWIMNRCPPFRELFADRRVLEWSSGWERMSKNVLYGVKQSPFQSRAAPVVVTCLDKLISISSPEEDMCLNSRAVALTVQGIAIYPSAARRIYDFTGGNLVSAYIINFCPSFFPQLSHEDLVEKAKDEQLGRADLAYSTVNTWIHEISHLPFTFKAPIDPVPDNPSNSYIRAVAEKEGLATSWNRAEPNSQFCAWTWWNAEAGYRELSWDGN